MAQSQQRFNGLGADMHVMSEVRREADSASWRG